MRGPNWSRKELGHLAEAWVATTENPVLGIDQTSDAFRVGLHRNFISIDENYKRRDKQPVRAKFGDVSKEVSKFNKSLREVRGFNPTGVSAENIFSMAVARHLAEFNPLSTNVEARNMYNFKDFDVKQWVYVEACKVLHQHPKYTVESENNTPQAATGGVPDPGDGHVNEDGGSIGSSGGNQDPRNATRSVTGSDSNPGIPDEDPPSTTPRSRQARGGMKGRRAAKADEEMALRQRQAVQCLGFIGESLKRKSIAMEDANAMLAFRISMPDETSEDKEMKALFLRTKRQKLIQTLLQESNSPTSRTLSARASCHSDPDVVSAASVDVMAMLPSGTQQ